MKHLQKLKDLPNLRRLELMPVREGSPKNLEVEVPCLKEFTQLEALSLKMLPITNDNLKELLSGLTQLQQLSLISSRGFTDEGLLHLKNLPKLEKLDLSSTEITKDGIKNLEKLTSLKVLDLVHMPTDAPSEGLQYLENLSSLQTLCVSFPNDPDQKALKAKRPALNIVSTLRAKPRVAGATTAWHQRRGMEDKPIILGGLIIN